MRGPTITTNLHPPNAFVIDGCVVLGVVLGTRSTKAVLTEASHDGPSCHLERVCYISIAKRHDFASDSHLTKNMILQLQTLQLDIAREEHKDRFNYRSPQKATKTNELSRNLPAGKQEPEGRLLDRPARS